MPDRKAARPRSRMLDLMLAVSAAMITLGLWQGARPGSQPVSVSESNTEFAVRKSPDGYTGGNDIANNFIENKIMLPGRCFAGSPVDDNDALGGFATSDNMPKKVDSDSQGKGLYLLAEPEKEMPHGEQSFMRLTLVNRTDSPVAFPAQDSRLSIIQEAQGEAGRWRPIEFLIAATCGNSYHKVVLPAGHFWEFAVPRYQGPLKTKLRFTYLGEDGKNIRSNEFEGSIHPSQFVLPDELKEMHPHGIINAQAYGSLDSGEE